MINSISPKFLALLLAVLTTSLNAADLLVAMGGGGTVERYESATGKHVGTFISRIERPNALAFGPDGALYVATGAVGGATGLLLDDFLIGPFGDNEDSHWLAANNAAFPVSLVASLPGVFAVTAVVSVRQIHIDFERESISRAEAAGPAAEPASESLK
jgi:hypothetical protein